MVIPEKPYLSSRYEYCRMHDMMREVCLSKAKEENFLQIIKDDPTSNSSTINAQSPNRSRRLAIHSGNALHILGQKNNKKARFFVFLGREKDWKQIAPGFQSLPLLRVLNLFGVKFEGGKLPSRIGGLIHLRFLNLCQAVVSHIPSTMRNLKRLLYLDLNVAATLEPVYVPNFLKEMLELRYLALPWVMHDKTKLELGDLVNLEYLWHFSPQHSSVTDLLRMINLRILVVTLSKRCIFKTISSSFPKLRNLETLCFVGWTRTPVDNYVGEFFLDFIHLKELTLAVNMSKIPDLHQFPPHVAHIDLSGCRMEEDPMPILEKMFHLKSVELRHEAFVGRKIMCSKSGFPLLFVLNISEQSELEEWIVEQGSMPCLGTLMIHDCKKLKALPDGLKYITSLKEVKIVGMKREWMEKLIPGGEDYYKVQHIPSVQFINCDE